jgi:hypothetical protein
VDSSRYTYSQGGGGIIIIIIIIIIISSSSSSSSRINSILIFTQELASFKNVTTNGTTSQLHTVNTATFIAF